LTSSAITWTPEPPDPSTVEYAGRLNTSGAMVDFGPVATNGAFRLLHKDAIWQLIPLPDSPAFTVELRLSQLDAGTRKVRAITPVNIDGTTGAPVNFTQDGPIVRFDTGAGIFAYRIEFGG
jgi:hypothetical protein